MTVGGEMRKQIAQCGPIPMPQRTIHALNNNQKMKKVHSFGIFISDCTDYQCEIVHYVRALISYDE